VSRCIYSNRRIFFARRQATLHALKELPHQLFGHAFEKTLADTGHHAAHLAIAGNMHRGLVAGLVLQGESALAADKARRSGALDDQPITARRGFLFHRDFAVKGALDRPDTDFHRRLEFIGGDFGQLLAARRAMLQRLWISQQVPDFL
jgi:hypothetical protein